MSVVPGTDDGACVRPTSKPHPSNRGRGTQTSCAAVAASSAASSATGTPAVAASQLTNPSRESILADSSIVPALVTQRTRGGGSAAEGAPRARVARVTDA